MLRRTIEIEPPAQTDRMNPLTVGSRPWWQTCNYAELETRVKAMQHAQVQALISEVGAAIAITSSIVNDVQKDPEQRRRARKALAFMVEKKRLLKSFVQNQAHPPVDEKLKKEEHQAREHIREGRIEEARAAVAAGDMATAITCILDLLDRNKP